jgi:hypothetical protein
MTVLTFPKIFALGTRYVERLFNGPVEVTEKIDGSQFNFMVANTPEGELIMRSKGAQVFPETKDANFKPVVEWVLSIQSKLVPGAIYHGETLSRPRHNILTYNRVPDGHFMLFGCRDVSGRYECSHYGLEMIADRLRCEVVPLIWAGDFETEIKADKMEVYRTWLERESVLGGPKIEGFVIKNYAENILIGGQVLTPLSAKFVSEAFKEKHKKEWQTGTDKLGMLIEQYRSVARWNKAIQHLRDRGELEQSPRDIGKLIKEVQVDLVEECREEIKEELFRLYADQLRRTAIRGLPEWYKESLASGAISDAA